MCCGASLLSWLDAAVSHPFVHSVGVVCVAAFAAWFTARLTRRVSLDLETARQLGQRRLDLVLRLHGLIWEHFRGGRAATEDGRLDSELGNEYIALAREAAVLWPSYVSIRLVMFQNQFHEYWDVARGVVEGAGYTRVEARAKLGQVLDDSLAYLRELVGVKP
jgi:hypothetical protein